MSHESLWSADKEDPVGGARHQRTPHLRPGPGARHTGVLALTLVAALAGLGVLDAAVPASSSGSATTSTGLVISSTTSTAPSTVVGTSTTVGMPSSSRTQSARTAAEGAKASKATRRTKVAASRMIFGRRSTTTTTSTTTAPKSVSSIQPVGPTAGSWRSLIFDSEFNGTALDTSHWSMGWFGSGITKWVDSNEQDCYDPAQVRVSTGTLNLTAVARAERCGGVTQPFASGIVTTDGKFSFTHGYMEARIWMPGSRSITDWPAFWADGQSWPTTGEIDTVEGLGGTACAHFHNSAGGPGACASGSYGGAWHTFAADWEPGSVTYYYDGTKIWTDISGITSAPMYLILNLAVSSSVSAPTVAPATMRVDYVRVWQH